MKIIRDGLWFCSDCTMVACNGAHGADIEPEQLQRTETGLAKLGANVVSDLDGETGDGLETFSSVPCDSCGSHLAGYRARFAILGDEEDEPGDRCLFGASLGNQCEQTAELSEAFGFDHLPRE